MPPQWPSAGGSRHWTVHPEPRDVAVSHLAPLPEQAADAHATRTETSGFVRDADGALILRRVLPQALPWVTFLPTEAVEELVAELVATLRAAVSIDNLWPVSQLLVEWRHTAEIYADPLRYAAATRVLDGDGGPVPRPEAWREPKRGDRAAPPPGEDEYDIRFADNQIAASWEQLCAQAVGNTRRAWEAIVADPRPKPPNERHHQLKHALATRAYRGRILEQWQYEVGTGHPKATD